MLFTVGPMCCQFHAFHFFLSTGRPVYHKMEPPNVVFWRWRFMVMVWLCYPVRILWQAMRSSNVMCWRQIAVGTFDALVVLQEKLEKHCPVFGYHITKWNVIGGENIVPWAGEIFRCRDVILVSGHRLFRSLIGSDTACGSNKEKNCRWMYRGGRLVFTTCQDLSSEHITHSR